MNKIKFVIVLTDINIKLCLYLSKTDITNCTKNNVRPAKHFIGWYTILKHGSGYEVDCNSPLTSTKECYYKVT